MLWNNERWISLFLCISHLVECFVLFSLNEILLILWIMCFLSVVSEYHQLSTSVLLIISVNDTYTTNIRCTQYVLLKYLHCATCTEFGPSLHMKIKLPKKTSCMYICQHCLVHLGDIGQWSEICCLLRVFICWYHYDPLIVTLSCNHWSSHICLMSSELSFFIANAHSFIVFLCTFWCKLGMLTEVRIWKSNTGIQEFFSHAQNASLMCQLKHTIDSYHVKLELQSTHQRTGNGREYVTTTYIA